MEQDTYTKNKHHASTLLRHRHYQEAVQVLTSLLGKNTDDPDTWMMLAAAHAGLGDTGGVIKSCRKVISLQPQNTMAHSNLGIALLQQHHFNDAVASFRTVLALEPSRPGLHLNLGNALLQLNEHQEAEPCLKKAIKLQPDSAPAYNSLAACLIHRHDFSAAKTACQKALHLRPEFAEAHTNLGAALSKLGRLEQAESCHRRAIELNPGLAFAHYNMGNTLVAANKLTEAITHYRKALHINPVLDYTHGNLALAEGLRGDIRGALKTCREGLALHPHDTACHSTLLFSLIYDNETTAETLYREHVNWQVTQCQRITAATEHGNPRNPDRPLRIGYVSADLRNHSVAWFIEPVLASFDSSQYESWCYYNHHSIDRTTERLRSMADHWCCIADMPDEAVVDRIREDGIDILIDLSGHSAGNRLKVFAYKPAPLQLTWLGYPGTTGLETIDYRLTDADADLLGSGEFYSEQLLRLPGRFLCYTPPLQSPDPAPPPSLETGHTVFGSFNLLSKISPVVIQLWAGILRAIPDAGLLLKNSSFSDPATVNHYHLLFEQAGIERQRIRIIPWVAGLQEHLKLYNSVDISLDTFPYNGTTTTLESLWMGVPVITLAGQQHAGRVGATLLGAVDLHNLIAETPEQYVAIAVQLANNRNQLLELHTSLRGRLQASPLCDAQSFTRQLESTYRRIWEQWCRQASGKPADCSQ